MNRLGGWKCRDVGVLTTSAFALMLCVVGCERVARQDDAGKAGPPAVDPSSKTSASATAEVANCPFRLRDVTHDTGITFVHTDGSSGLRYIVESMSSGIATFDYDGDGLIDIYFPNGAPLPGCTEADRPPRHALYRNLGNWQFVDVTDQAGVECTTFGLGVTSGDFNNDGAQDLFVNNFGPNVLWVNNQDGTFQAVTQQAGIGISDLTGAGACFLDADADGDLELYVGNYIHLDCSQHVPRVFGGVPSYPTPRDYEPVPDELYRNNGDGTFKDISVESGVAAVAGRCMGITGADYDNDGDTDLFICNDVQQNFMLQNDGHGRFQDVSLIAGSAYNASGGVMANMGVDSADYNNDGWLDFFTTNYSGESPILFHNLGQGLFDDASARTNAGAGCYMHVNWGLGFVDLDNDGYKDLFIGNGHTEDNIEERMIGAVYKADYIVLRNVGGKFVNVSEQCVEGARRKLAAKGLAIDDLDNDGDLDLVVQASREGPMILRNMLIESGSQNHWLQVRLVGVSANRDAVGSRVIVSAGELTLIDEVHAGRSYQSHSGSRLQFGLGLHDKVDRIEVHWLGGQVEVLQDVEVDRLMTIVQRPDSAPGR